MPQNTQKLLRKAIADSVENAMREHMPEFFDEHHIDAAAIALFCHDSSSSAAVSVQ